MFSRRIWPVDFGPVRPHKMVSLGDLLREVPSDTDFKPGIASTLPLEAFWTQNIRILEAVFLRYIGVPEPLTRCPDGA